MNETSEPVLLDIPPLGNNGDSLFHPFTTTLIEIILNREPLPLGKATRIFTLGPPIFPEEK